MSNPELTKQQQQLAQFAKALGHSIRVAILQLLANQTCCYSVGGIGKLYSGMKKFERWFRLIAAATFMQY